MKKIVAGPFNRVEGDLEIQIKLEGNRIKTAYVNSPMYRGFEQILVGNDPLDAMVFTPRICGICSVSHSVASARALASYSSAVIPENGRLCINLIQACENSADIFTHFYLFFMPDFTSKEYEKHPWYPKIKERFQAVKGTAGSESLKMRTAFLQIMGILAGKWPHSLSIQPGGTSRPVEKHEQVKLLSIVHNFRNFLEKKLFALPLQELLAVSSKDDLIASMGNSGSDFGYFLSLSDDLRLDTLGTTKELLMSYGSYPEKDGYFLQPGVWRKERTELNLELITEDISHAWYSSSPTVLPPERGKTLPNLTKKDSYSWIKAPRLAGQVVEVGSLPRLIINGNHLLREEYKKNGSNVQSRVIARMLELAQTVVEMENWIKKISPGNPFCNPLVKPVSGKGIGLTEAARGGLGHWIQLKDGKIENYQIIAPTTWNFSPRDQNGNPGVLEKALCTTTLANPSPNSVEIQHIVRSFDPCMSCTVH